MNNKSGFKIENIIYRREVCTGFYVAYIQTNILAL